MKTGTIKWTWPKPKYSFELPSISIPPDVEEYYSLRLPSKPGKALIGESFECSPHALNLLKSIPRRRTSLPYDLIGIPYRFLSTVVPPTYCDIINQDNFKVWERVLGIDRSKCRLGQCFAEDVCDILLMDIVPELSYALFVSAPIYMHEASGLKYLFQVVPGRSVNSAGVCRPKVEACALVDRNQPSKIVFLNTYLFFRVNSPAVDLKEVKVKSK